MPTKTAMLIARLNPEVKKEAEAIFKELGLSTSEAINVFFNQVRLRKGLPFEISIPSVEKKIIRKGKNTQINAGEKKRSKTANCLA